MKRNKKFEINWEEYKKDNNIPDEEWVKAIARTFFEFGVSYGYLNM